MPLEVKEIVDTELEKKIITALIVSDKYCRDIEKLIKFSYFKTKFTKTIAQWCIEYYARYKVAPKSHIQDIYLSKIKKIREVERELIEEFLEILSDEYEQQEKELNKDYLVDKTISYFKERNLEILADEIKANINMGNVDEAEKLIIDHHKVDKITSDWINPFDEHEIEKTFDDVSDNQLFSLPGALGDLVGSFEREWLVAWLGPYKRGKTNFLYETAMAALHEKRKVAFFSLEMGEVKSKIRLYKRITALAEPGHEGNIIYPVFDCKKNQLDTCEMIQRTGKGFLLEDYGDELPQYDPKLEYETCSYCRNHKKFNKEYELAIWYTNHERKAIDSKTTKKAIKNFKFVYGDNLRLKIYPAFTASFSDIEKDLDLLEYTEGFIPDVIIIDYFDILGSGDRRLVGRDAIDHTWKSGKRLGAQRKACVVTATQVGDKRILDAKNVKASNIGEDGRKLGHVDLVLILSQLPEEKKKGYMRISTGVFRHGDFNELAQVRVLQNLNIGQAIIDSELERR